MTRTDVFGFLNGILVTLQAVVAAAVVAFIFIYLLAMGLPLPSEGLLAEVIPMAIFLAGFYAVLFGPLFRAACRSRRDFLTVLAGMTAANLIGEILAMAGVFDFMSAGAAPTVIPDWLLTLLTYMGFGAVAYLAYASAQQAKVQAS